jgi:hypothetical protein
LILPVIRTELVETNLHTRIAVLLIARWLYQPDRSKRS